MPISIEVPALGESVKQAILVKWHKEDGAMVAADEPVCELETDKANVDVPAPKAGVLRRMKNGGDTVNVGEAIAAIEEGGTPTAKPAKVAAPAAKAEAAPAEKSPASADDLSPAVRVLVAEHGLDPKSIKATGPGGRITKEDVLAHVAASTPKAEAPKPEAPKPAPVAPPTSSTRSTKPSAPPVAGGIVFDNSGIHRAPMSKIRKRIAENLLRAQSTAAILTTFNEVDLTAVMELRKSYKDSFEKAHGIGLGFMSFFGKAVVMALREFPRVNAFIEGDDIVYHQHVHLGIAVSTDRGLAVPVLKHVEDMSFAKIESEIKRVATAVRDGKLGLDELSGGTFTITNGGVFGSLLSTPILNPPQSGILGMHTIQKRPMVITKNGQDTIEIRPMMYIALSYDHRVVDGKESISFLVKVKQLLEDPSRMLLEV